MKRTLGMKIRFIILLVLAEACSQQEADTPLTPAMYVAKNSKEVEWIQDTLYVNHQKYSGFVYEFAENQKDTLLIEGFVGGLLNGVAKKYYPNGQLMEYRHYKAGEKHGKQVAFWENGKKRFEFVAVNGVYEGQFKEYSVEGKLFHLATYKNGQEGPQKMWYDNGKIRANYVIRNGKRYGLLGTKNCKNVSDSIFVVR
ncbi:MAG: toxin-antitoxin system YwqK family antitoxin [Spirosomataceae bacterium]